MAEKISFVLDATVRGVKSIATSASAAERLTKAIADQRSEIITLNSQLKKVEGYQHAVRQMAKFKEQSKSATERVAELDKQLTAQKARTHDLRVAFSQTESELKGLNAALKKASGEGAEQLKVKAKAAELRLKALNTEIHDSKIKTSELNKVYKKAQQRVIQLSDKQLKQRDKLRDLGSALKNAGLNTKRLADEQRRLKEQSDRATAAIEKQNAHLKQMQVIRGRINARKEKLGEIRGHATSLAIAAAPIAASVWSAVKNESSFADVKKVVNMTPEQAAKMQSWSLKTAASKKGGGMDANEINAMLAAGGRSGIKDINALKQFVLDSAQMGVAFDMDAGKAGKTLATFKAGLGLDQKGALSLAGMINYLSADSNMDPEQLADVMAREGATAKMAGFKNSESAALATAMISTGMESERASTALKNISGRLTLGSAASGTQRKALASIGLDSVEIASSMQDNASGTLLDVLDAIKSAPLEQQSALMSQIFGEEAKGAVSALAGNTKEFIRLLKLARDPEEKHLNSLKKEFVTKINTSAVSIEIFVNKLNRLSTTIGQSLQPALKWALEPLGEMVDGIANFAESHKTVTAVITGTGTALIGLGGAFLSLKAASLVFRNMFDKGRLFRKGLSTETEQSGKAARYAARQFRRLNDTLYQTGKGGRSGGDAGYSGRERKSRRRGGRFSRMKRRALAPMRAMRMRGGGKFGRVFNLASTLFTHKQGALPMSMAGGALAMAPMASMAQDAIDVTGDIAEGFGKAGLTKVLRPLSMAISAGNIASDVINGDTKGAISEGGGLLGGMGGAAAGAALGTMIFPGVGTLLGGIAGSLLGDWGGRSLSGALADHILKPIPPKKLALNEVNKKIVSAPINDKQLTKPVARKSPEAPPVKKLSLSNTLYGGERLVPKHIPNKLMPAEELKKLIAENRKKEAAQRTVTIAPSITINAAPGMDEQKVAEIAVEKAVERIKEELDNILGLSISDSLAVSFIDRD